MSDRRPIRCGWCISGHHERCVVVLRMGDSKSARVRTGAKAPYLWWCPCTDTDGHGEHPRTRCVDCLRPNVEVTEGSTCKDQTACKRFIARHGQQALDGPDREDSHAHA